MLPLAGGTSMPQLGFGVWQLSDTEAEAAAARRSTSGTGWWTPRPPMATRRARAASVARDDVFVTTKLWIVEPEPHQPVPDLLP